MTLKKLLSAFCLAIMIMILVPGANIQASPSNTEGNAKASVDEQRWTIVSFISGNPENSEDKVDRAILVARERSSQKIGFFSCTENINVVSFNPSKCRLMANKVFSKADLAQMQRNIMFDLAIKGSDALVKSAAAFLFIYMAAEATWFVWPEIPEALISVSWFFGTVWSTAKI